MHPQATKKCLPFLAADWMRSKLLQAVGLGPRWRPQQEQAASDERTSSSQRPCQRQRRLPAALLQAELDSAGSWGGQQQQPARRRSRSHGPGGEGAGKRARGAAPARPAASSPDMLEKPPMVVIVMADHQGQLHMPAWPGVPGMPAQLPLAGGRPLPARHLLQAIQQAQQAQHASHRAQSAPLARQLSWGHGCFQQSRQLSAETHPSLLQIKEEAFLAQPPDASTSAQLAAWRALQAAGFAPQLEEQPAALAAAQSASWGLPAARLPPITTQEVHMPHHPPAAWQHHAQEPAAPPSPPMATSVSPPARAHAPALAEVQQQQTSPPATASLHSGSTAMPSPFAVAASLPLPPQDLADPTPAPLQHSRSLPLSALHASTRGLSLLELDALLSEGTGSASLASPCTISTDLHRLFAAWEQGLVSMPRPARGSSTMHVHTRH